MGLYFAIVQPGQIPSGAFHTHLSETHRQSCCPNTSAWQVQRNLKPLPWRSVEAAVAHWHRSPRIPSLDAGHSANNGLEHFFDPSFSSPLNFSVPRPRFMFCSHARYPLASMNVKLQCRSFRASMYAMAVGSRHRNNTPQQFESKLNVTKTLVHG